MKHKSLCPRSRILDQNTPGRFNFTHQKPLRGNPDQDEIL